MEWAILLTILVAALGLYGAIAYLERPRGPLQTVELRFGTDVTVAAVQALLASVAGLRSNTVVLLDTRADSGGVRHFLHAPQATLDTLRSQWRGVLPSLRMEASVEFSAADWRSGAVVRLAGARPVIREDATSEAAASVLASTMPLGRDERVLIRWCVGAGAHPVLPATLSRREAHHAKSALAHLLLDESTPQSAHVRALRAKYAGPLLNAVGVVAISAEHPKRAAHLLSRVVSAMRSRGGAYGQIAARRRGPHRLAWLLDRPGLRRPDLYSPSELAGLWPVPIGAPRLPGVVLGTAPVFMPSPRIPCAGRVLAVSDWPGSEDRVLAQPIVGGLSHTLIAAPTGGGKSELIAGLAAGDVRAGRALFLLDGKGDTADGLLAHIPESRIKDVILLNPGSGPVPGLRLFGGGADPQLMADLVTSIFADIFKESWGPFSSRWVRAGLTLLALDAEAGIADFPFLFSRDEYRRRLVARVQDPVMRETFRLLESMGPTERAHQLSAPLQKVEEIIGRPVIRAVLGQGREAKLDMHDALAHGKIVIVSLNAGRIGSAAARLLSSVCLFKFFQAVQARAAITPAARRPVFAYIDEPGIFADIPVPLDDAFAVARGLGVGLTLSTQSVSQLAPELARAALSNAATLIALRQNSSMDARLFGAELGVEPEGLQHLEKFQAIMRIGLGPGDVAPVATGHTLPLPPAISDPESVRQASAARYGTAPAAVDAALLARHQTIRERPETPIGRRRSSS